ncbi:MAG: hypothetical protein JW795_06700 [Chitinivibrionales bacterium]|nr:hypothetical protein [Chitinivibrionales bacterium]
MHASFAEGPTASTLEKPPAYQPWSGSLIQVGKYNSSFLATLRLPRTEVSIPFPLSMQLTIDNNKLTLPLTTALFSSDKTMADHVAWVLQNSFHLNGLSPDAVSESITRNLENGVTFRSFVSAPLFNIAHTTIHRNGRSSGWALTSEFFSSGQAHVAGDWFSLLFSPTSGLQPGNKLRFCGTRADLTFATDIRLAYGWSSVIPVALFGVAPQASTWGFELLYRVGHGFASAIIDSGSCTYSTKNTASIDATISILSAGLLSTATPLLQNPNPAKTPIRGHGFSVSHGATFLFTHSSFSWALHDIGVMMWNKDLVKTTVTIKKDSLYLIELLDGGLNNSIKLQDTSRLKALIEPLESSLSLRYAFALGGQTNSNAFIAALLNNTHGIVDFTQVLPTRVKRVMPPDIALSIERAFLHQSLPLGFGWSVHDYTTYSSTIKTGLAWHGIMLSATYRCFHELLFRPKKGIEIQIDSQLYW